MSGRVSAAPLLNQRWSRGRYLCFLVGRPGHHPFKRSLTSPGNFRGGVLAPLRAARPASGAELRRSLRGGSEGSRGPPGINVGWVRASGRHFLAAPEEPPPLQTRSGPLPSFRGCTVVPAQVSARPSTPGRPPRVRLAPTTARLAASVTPPRPLRGSALTAGAAASPRDPPAAQSFPVWPAKY